MIYHILPVDDIYDHKEIGYDCKCGTRVEKQPNGDWMVVHRSYDRREDKEKDSITKTKRAD